MIKPPISSHDDRGANCYECALYGSREDPAVIRFCHGCLEKPGRRQYCLAFEGEDFVLRPVGTGGDGADDARRRAARGTLWVLLEWSPARRGYVPLG
ncbi:MAG: hypothetical protein AB7U81_06255 [Thiohalomonadaceae bacterium]